MVCTHSIECMADCKNAETVSVWSHTNDPPSGHTKHVWERTRDKCGVLSYKLRIVEGMAKSFGSSTEKFEIVKS